MRNRWIVLGIFYLSSVLNYLDRSVMAALSPMLREQLGFSLTDYGWLQGIFSAFYAFSAPIAGLLVDRYGLTIATISAVGFWSVAGMARGLAGNFMGLMATHTVIPQTVRPDHKRYGTDYVTGAPTKRDRSSTRHAPGAAHDPRARNALGATLFAAGGTRLGKNAATCDRCTSANATA